MERQHAAGEGGALGAPAPERAAPDDAVTDDPGQGRSAPLWQRLGLRAEEYDRIVGLLGREPNPVELAMFAALWSEHCAYKHSRPLLSRLPSRGPALLLGPGENAGVVDLGSVAVALRVESHNHPTAVEPYHGAATGAGGIIRDILAVGARPIALMASMRFGDPRDDKARRLFAGAVEGFADYANGSGVPAVGVDAAFEPVYRDNPLVNVVCVGVAPKDRILRARASGAGNALMLVGGKTGRDGVLGASFASGELPAEGGPDDSPVQIGNPESGRRLIEASLEIAALPGVIGVQDMGAAGITSSVAETASRAGSGADIDVSRVPQRDPDMTPHEILLSESQERMLFVVKRGHEAEVEAVARRWGLEVAVFGRVTDDGMFTVRNGDELVAHVPVRALTEEAPQYTVAVPESDGPAAPDFSGDGPTDVASALTEILTSPNGADRAPVYGRFRPPEAVEALSGPGDRAAVLRLPQYGRTVVLAVEGRGRHCQLDPYTGAALTVAEACRHVVCTGARPLAITNGLNLGNPEKPHVYRQLEQVVEGMAAACRALDVPVSGGNVSLYNETAGEPVYPTPVVGVLGALEEGLDPLPPAWRDEGQTVVVLGDAPSHLGGSEYACASGAGLAGPAPHLDLELEARLQELVLRLHREGRLRAARSVSTGGLLTGLFEMAVAHGVGVEVELAGLPSAPEVFLFGEGGSRVVAALESAAAEAARAMAEEARVPWRVVGRTGGDRLRVQVDGRVHVDAALADLETPWRSALAHMLEKESH